MNLLFPVSLQSKNLRKLIQNHFKQYAQLKEHECVYKFFDTLSTVNKFNQERFRCNVGVSVLYQQLRIIADFNIHHHLYNKKSKSSKKQKNISLRKTGYRLFFKEGYLRMSVPYMKIWSSVSCFEFYFQSTTSWGISMEIVIGPEVGISYQTEKSSSVSSPGLDLNVFYLEITQTRIHR